MKVNSSKLSLAIREYKLGKDMLSTMAPKEKPTDDEKAGMNSISRALDFRLKDAIDEITEVNSGRKELYKNYKSIMNTIEFLYSAYSEVLVRVIKNTNAESPFDITQSRIMSTRSMVSSIYDRAIGITPKDAKHVERVMAIAKDKYLLADLRSISLGFRTIDSDIELVSIIEEAITDAYNVLCN